MSKLQAQPLHFFRVLALVALALPSLPTYAQYQWRDANGSMVFSDRPPPPGASVRLVKAPPVPTVAASTPKAATASVPSEKVAVNGTEKSLTDKVKQTEKADKAKVAAENEQLAKDQARQCESLRENSRVLQSGERLSKLSKSGEREFMSDAEKNARLQENTRDLAKYCK